MPPIQYKFEVGKELPAYVSDRAHALDRSDVRLETATGSQVRARVEREPQHLHHDQCSLRRAFGLVHRRH